LQNEKNVNTAYSIPLVCILIYHSLLAMANKLKNMYNIKSIYRLLLEGNSQRKTSALLGISRNTVKSYANLLSQLNLKLADIVALDDATLLAIVSSVKKQATPLQDARHKKLASHFSYIEKELKRTGVTLYHLWEAYKAKNTDAYGYVQFCHHYKQYIQRHKATMHFEHIIGDTLMIDYAGDKISYIDKETGEVIGCQVLVAVLPYSGYTFAYAMHTQSQPDFINGMNECFSFLGGVPKNILSDNLKTVVSKSDRYEPKFSDLVLQFSDHYKTNLMATRVAKPTDKGKVENAVTQVYRQIYAPLRNKEMHSLAELNNEIANCLSGLNSKSFQRKTYSRADLFIEERTKLNALPATIFELYKVKKAMVQRNYHIQIDNQYYSVPYTYVGKEVNVFYNTKTVEIYTNQARISLHTKTDRIYSYNTIAEHMPSNHTGYLQSRGWDADYFRSKASEVGTYTLAFVEKLFTTKIYIEQTYLSCTGLFRLVGIYNALRVEQACKRLENVQKVNYKMVEEILNKNLDQQITPTPQQQNPSVGTHTNIRANYN
jgi:transposase